ncbi:hypothetical protein RFI_28471 [Reticulomyxa filosa]|uniref:Uncharacterized protein n=1 Tax=Reticulomyxa filosa TaxID=46433 RepID=X6M4M0_RETFI|nr:hypothetical protein RFI_28471 [Reticulomyxa filosa]|eukprot:ETO08918.1 hypothetical protein RFI_28471 [Reticulomyxa filosa]
MIALEQIQKKKIEKSVEKTSFDKEMEARFGPGVDTFFCGNYLIVFNSAENDETYSLQIDPFSLRLTRSKSVPLFEIAQGTHLFRFLNWTNDNLGKRDLIKRKTRKIVGMNADIEVPDLKLDLLRFFISKNSYTCNKTLKTHEIATLSVS